MNLPKYPFSLQSPLANIRALYDGFDAPICGLDCGQMCAPHNPGGKPFCCDICHAVPAAYREEWNYLQERTDLWHAWRGDECNQQEEPISLQDETPENMLLLACLGPQACQRNYRALSCRQFPFFPYITTDYRFLGLAYDWEFTNKCWIISHLEEVTKTYCAEFVQTYDQLFAFSQEAFDSYFFHSELLRECYAGLHKRFVLIHRNGGYYLVSPRSERSVKTTPEKLPKFGVYQESNKLSR